jgi:hypothetical protein
MNNFSNKKYGYGYLLGKSAKIDKSDKASDFENFIMYLAPHNLSGTNICAFASQGCAKACLYSAGRGKFTSVQKARLNRTKHYLSDRKSFLKRLMAEILFHSSIHENLAIRLNGTSDLNFNSFIRTMGEIAPNVQFYDYTKDINKAIKALNIPNYHITFSRSESNFKDVLTALAYGIKVAVVFDEIPKVWNGYNVQNGDNTDTRFLDYDHSPIIGLSAKGKAKYDNSGFVIRTKP